MRSLSGAELAFLRRRSRSGQRGARPARSLGAGLPAPGGVGARHRYGARPASPSRAIWRWRGASPSSLSVRVACGDRGIHGLASELMAMLSSSPERRRAVRITPVPPSVLRAGRVGRCGGCSRMTRQRKPGRVRWRASCAASVLVCSGCRCAQCRSPPRRRRPRVATRGRSCADCRPTSFRRGYRLGGRILGAWQTRRRHVAPHLPVRRCRGQHPPREHHGAAAGVALVRYHDLVASHAAHGSRRPHVRAHRRRCLRVLPRRRRRRGSRRRAADRDRRRGLGGDRAHAHPISPW